MEKKPQLDPKTHKNLYYLLTFGSTKENLPITSDGFYRLDTLLQNPLFKTKRPSPDAILEAIASDNSSLYEIKTNETESFSHYIRLKQDQNITSETLKKVTEPSKVPLCVYKTNVETWKLVKKEGIKVIPGQGDFITLWTNSDVPSGETANILLDTFIEIDVGKAMKDGIEFYKGEDGQKVYIKSEIPLDYFSKAYISIKGKLNEIDLTGEKKDPAQKEQEKLAQMQREQDELRNFKIEDNETLKGNHFRYICVLDFEAQCTEDEKLKVQEIIEFPVVIVDVEQKEIVEVFHHYVKPTVYPQLFPFCTDLTGITQDKVQNAKTLPEVIEELHKFLEEKGILQSSFCFLTCGDWDLAICLRQETKKKEIAVNNYLKRWINIKKVYPMPPNCAEKKMGMVGLLKMSHLELEGKHHSGIDDAMNIARVVNYLLKMNFKFTKPMVAYVAR